MNNAGIVFMVVVIIVLSFFGGSEYNKNKVKKENELIQQGYIQAANDISNNIMQTAATCKSIPLTSGNVTINLIAIECLPQEVLDMLNKG